MQKTADGNSRKSFDCDTYKQALRGLFITGTSVIRQSFSESGHPLKRIPELHSAKGYDFLKLRRIKEKVGNEPGLNHASQRDVLYNLAGINRK